MNEEHTKGEAIAALLGLKQCKDSGWFNTSIGTKSAIGLYHTVNRLMNDKEFAIDILKGKKK